ncbi:tail fiber protein [Flagellimonas hadalis]|uniref:Peptidase S74 domain-containing protein n=1 Tax=Flagellimonas hadalis TaxID=2597517 RepID=A0A5N5IN67_9FLAO|nr:tail fiber protein [Allomuricauda hadalis]KAB5483121.1 hypothetical protein FOT42_017750 [Allomuricauda hadalis]
MGINNGDNLYLGSVDAPVNNLFVNLNGNNRVTVSGTTGYVGIGTINPTSNLDVYKYDGISHTRIYTNQHNGIAKLEIAGGVAGFGASYSGWTLYHSHNHTEKDLYFKYGQSGNPSVVFTDNGNVGIGTTVPGSKLTVKGRVHAEEVRVDLSVPGPDYVFKEGYDLKSIKEVQNYIKEHGHLPNIPTAKEMEVDGIQLGEMNMKLLEKIEELTLYIIQQQYLLENIIEQYKLQNKEIEYLKSRQNE